jgi:hypothetical protein
MEATLAGGQGSKSGRGDDIFHTPANDHFYSKTHYNKLNAQGKEIRLLKVLPDNGSSAIEYELVQGVLLADVQGQYSALSYCAGDARKTGTILVNGIRCNVFANLAHALVECRHFWRQKFKDREFLLWVDQICINQPNIQERSHQVGFMRDIYQFAEQVLICLSTTETNGEGMKWLL